MDNFKNFKEAKINSLSELLYSEKKLSTEEYVSLLKEIRKNYTIRLLMLSHEHLMMEKGMSATMNIVEKVHYLVDSVETKNRHKLTQEESPSIGWSDIRLESVSEHTDAQDA